MKKIRGYQHELPANQDRHNRKILQEQKKEERKRKKQNSMIRTRSGFMPDNVQMDAVVVEVEEEEKEAENFNTSRSLLRRYSDLHAVTLFYNPNFDHRKIWYYGCHCLMLHDRAMSTRGKGEPVDQLDSLCKRYKECVHCAKTQFGDECIPEAVRYKWAVTRQGDVKSKNKENTCKEALYQCDIEYATQLQETSAMTVFNNDYHGFYTTTGFDHKTEESCETQPEDKCDKCVDNIVECAEENDSDKSIVHSCNAPDGTVQITAELYNPSRGAPDGFVQDALDELKYTAKFTLDDDLDQSFTVNEIDEHVLVLSKRFEIAGCDSVKVDGTSVCRQVGRTYNFQCWYPLRDFDVDSTFQVTGTDHEDHAAGQGNLEYTLAVDSAVQIGQRFNMKVVPKNPGLVYATVKSCYVMFNEQEVAMFGHNQPKCINNWLGASWLTEFASSRDTVEGYWTAFKWSTSSNKVEEQQLKCNIALSRYQNTDEIVNCQY